MPAPDAETSTAAPGPICYECFWHNYAPSFRAELVSVYDRHRTKDRLVEADKQLLLARVSEDARLACKARRRFGSVARRDRDPARRLFALETLAFTAGECGEDPSIGFQKAAAAARESGEDFKARIYEQVAEGRFHPAFDDATIRRRISAPEGTRAYVLGESAIRVDRAWRVGVQVERTVRDWISFQLGYDLSGRAPRPETIVGWHEGARLREILVASPVTVLPLEGVLAARQGDRWMAPDENGVFRFEVLPDKVQYPTTRGIEGLALLVDTHGVSSLVEASLRVRARLVIGCGDHPEKMKAAFHLAAKGVDVYFPCDRFVGDLLGYDAPGILIGSAPVRSEGGSAVIGDRPVRFEVDETLVVEDSLAPGDNRYYDAAARYFRRLSEVLPLKLDLVAVGGPGEAGAITRRADELGASAIALRVMSAEDAAPVRTWLAGSPARRAVLFHSAPYPAGYALFSEFPGRTTFGDPRPRFLGP